jgi:hypothetical protein
MEVNAVKIWIEDNKGNMIECEEVKTVSVPDSILVFETDRKVTKPYLDDFHTYIKERTGHECVLVDGGIKLVAQVSPRGVV